MTIPFFESNQNMLEELRAMNHNTKEYKKTMQKIFIDIGGINNLFEYLKSTEDKDRSKKKYFRSLLFIVVIIIMMFASIFVAVFLTSGKDTEAMSDSEILILFGFLIFFIACIVSMFIIAFSARKILLNGVSFLIDNYNTDSSDNNQPDSMSLNTYVSNRNKTTKKTALIIVFIILFFVLIRLISYAVISFADSQKKEFSKAGISITLTNEFTENENIMYTASFNTEKYYVACIKEDFKTLSEYGVSSDMTLKEYAALIIENNSLVAKIEGTEDKPYFAYKETKDGVDYTDFEVLYKTSDAYWIVSFTCFSKDFESSKDKFIKWSDTVKFEQ